MSLVVERCGFVEQGYTTRAAVLALAAAAVARDPEARAVFVGTGVAWSAAEGALVATGARTGPATLDATAGGAALGAVLRGFAEGAAVLALGMAPRGAPAARAAVAVLLLDAAWRDDACALVSRREVLSPLGLAVTALLSAVYLARLALAARPLLPPAAVARTAALGLAWNGVAVLSGARAVDPPQWGMLFVLFDAVFEVALLYAGIGELVLLARRALTGSAAHREPRAPGPAADRAPPRPPRRRAAPLAGRPRGV